MRNRSIRTSNPHRLYWQKRLERRALLSSTLHNRVQKSDRYRNYAEF